MAEAVTQITLPYEPSALGTHLMAFGLMSCLEANGIDTLMHATIDRVHVDVIDADERQVARCVRESAIAAREAIEADFDVGGRLKPLLIAGPDQRIIEAREGLIERAEQSNRAVARMIAGVSGVIPVDLGAREVRLARSLLDGAPRNAHADLLRSVVRPAREHAAQAGDDLFDDGAFDDQNLDGWTPRGIKVGLAWKWLACLGLGWFPVRPVSVPARYVRRKGLVEPPEPWVECVHGVVLRDLVHSRPDRGVELVYAQRGPVTAIAIPIFDRPTAHLHVRALVGSADVPIAAHARKPRHVMSAADVVAATLCAQGVTELAVFDIKPGRSPHMRSCRFMRAEFVALKGAPPCRPPRTAPLPRT